MARHLLNWIAAVVVVVLLAAAQVLDQDPEALQLVADEAAAVAQDVQRLARVDAALAEQGVQRP